MGKKRRTIANPQKFGGKHAARPYTDTLPSEAPVAAKVVEAETVVEEETVAPTKPKTVKKTPITPRTRKTIKKATKKAE